MYTNVDRVHFLISKIRIQHTVSMKHVHILQRKLRMAKSLLLNANLRRSQKCIDIMNMVNKWEVKKSEC